MLAKTPELMCKFYLASNKYILKKIYLVMIKAKLLSYNLQTSGKINFGIPIFTTKHTLSCISEKLSHREIILPRDGKEQNQLLMEV